jgi:hypothetical protein
MATPRRFGQELNQNARRGPNITPADRLKILTKHSLSVTVNELVEEFRRSRSAIKYTIRTYSTTTTTQEQPRSGCLPILSLH